MQKTDKKYKDLTVVQKRIYELSFCNLLCNPHMTPMTKEEVHEIAMSVVDCWDWAAEQGNEYNPAD